MRKLPPAVPHEATRAAVWRIAGATLQNSIGLGVVGYLRHTGGITEYPAVALIAAILGVMVWPAVKSKDASKVGTLGCFVACKPALALLIGMLRS